MKKSVDPIVARDKAEEHYRNGNFYCSEAIVKTFKDELDLQISDNIIAAASGFPVGIGGSGCVCGAITGGVMVIGLLFGRTQPKSSRVEKAMELAQELHNTFKTRHRSTCCRVLLKGMELGTSEHIKQCISFTGEIAAEVAKIINRELQQ